MAKSVTLKHEIRGKTELDVEVEYLKWLQKNAGKVRIIEKSLPMRLPLRAQDATKHRPIETQDAYSILIEHVILRSRPMRKAVSQ